MNAASMSDVSEHTISVLVVDDDPPIRRAWKWFLANDANEFEFYECANGIEALQLLASQQVDVVVTDVMMPGIDGMELLRRIKADRPEIEVLLMTAAGSIPDAVRATREGAFDYLTKPFTDIEECKKKVRQAAQLKRLRDENTQLRQQVEGSPTGPLMQSDSPAMKVINSQMARVAQVDSPVLITGPTGSGKSLIARVIHDASPRRNGPFMAIDCGNLQKNLIGSELFGHVKGAFTHAISDKIGLFEAAKGGTVFLDEVGNMGIEEQQKLLRVIQDGVVRRISDTRDIPVNVRVISATNADLNQAVHDGTFRADLYYRIRVVHFGLPPLADRREDIPRLAYHFLRKYAAKMGKEIQSITPRCMELLRNNRWKGNIRELEHAIEHALIFETGRELTERHLPQELTQSGDSAPVLESFTGQVNVDLPFRESMESAETAYRVAYLRGLMNKYRNVSAAARHAQVDRANFRRLLRRYGIHDYQKGQVSLTVAR